MRMSSLRGSLLLTLCLTACSGGSSNATPPDQGSAGRLVVSASTTVLEPSSAPAPRYERTLADVGAVASYYRLTTPADAPFSFDVVSWQPAASGSTRVSVAHLRDGDMVPTRPTSLGEAGMNPTGQGLERGEPWIAASGDGLARLTLQGRIQQDQLLAVRADGKDIALVEIVIGEDSVINRPVRDTDPPATTTRETVYSSDSLQFGLPTIAVSGDRTSIVAYEGDRADPFGGTRYELRLQHRAATGAVTGGATVETSPDSGWWRDHEVFALFNVLGVVRADQDGVRVRLSFDRGASFAQDVALLPGFSQSRLVQAAMAADYSVAIGAWRANQAGELQFVLVEGRPVAFDGNGSPTWFQFDPAQELCTRPGDATPLTTGIAWSAGGDLVVGYGATTFATVPTGGWLTTTEFRCWVRRFGQQPVDHEVDRQEIFGMDPTVAVQGQGATMRVFYAYEASDGVRLAVSDNAGDTWTVATSFGAPGDHLPSVFARSIGGNTRIDVLYLASGAQGLELHRSHWAAWGQSPRVDEALTTASSVQLPVTTPDPSGIPFYVPWNVRTTQLGWLGYDAALDGNTLVVAYDEVTEDCSPFYFGPGMPGGSIVLGVPTAASGPFRAATPPPLAPGLTEPVPAVDPLHRNQLVLLRLP